MRCAVLVTAIIVIVILAQTVAVEANPFNYPTVTIESPKYNIHTTSTPIEVIAYPHMTGTVFTKMVYSLDGNNNKTLVTSTIPSSSGFFGKGSLDNLTEGFHTFDVYSFDSQGNVIHANTTFQVEIKIYNERLIIDVAIVSCIFAIFTIVTAIIYKRRKISK